MYFKFILTSVFTILSSCYIFSQSTEYSVLYEYTDSYDVKLEGILIVDADESFFKILDERDAGIKYDENGEFMHYVTNDDISTIMHTNTQKCFVRIPWPALKGGSRYSYVQKELNWELTGNTKEIKKYVCQVLLLN